MTEVTRPALYGAQHPLVVVPSEQTDNFDTEQVVVSGHCCESGDILTPASGDPEGIQTRTLRKAKVGDYLVIESVGAYCSGMSLKNYNSFPEAAEVWFKVGSEPILIRKRQSIEQFLVNEISIF